MSNSDSFFKLYINSVDAFCVDQGKVIAWVKDYIRVKEGNLSEDEIIKLYIDIADDDEWSVPRDEEYGSKRSYIEYKLLWLIDRYKEVLKEDISVSFKRLDVLLGLIGKEVL